MPWIGQVDKLGAPVRIVHLDLVSVNIILHPKSLFFKCSIHWIIVLTYCRSVVLDCLHIIENIRYDISYLVFVKLYFLSQVFLQCKPQGDLLMVCDASNWSVTFLKGLVGIANCSVVPIFILLALITPKVQQIFAQTLLDIPILSDAIALTHTFDFKSFRLELPNFGLICGKHCGPLIKGSLLLSLPFQVRQQILFWIVCVHFILEHFVEVYVFVFVAQVLRANDWTISLLFLLFFVYINIEVLSLWIVRV